MLPLTKREYELCTFCNLPIILDKIPIYPMIIKELVEIGEAKYNFYLTLIISLHSTLEAISNDSIDIKKIKTLSDFELIILLISINDDFQTQIITAIKFFIKQKVSFNKEKEQFEIYDSGEKLLGILSAENYNDFIYIIKLQNYNLKEVSEDLHNPANKKADELLKKQAAAKAKLQQAKGKDAEPLNYTDYISILMSKSLDMNVDKCLNMTIFAFFTYLERLVISDTYEIGVQQLMAGAKVSDVKLKHWLTHL